ncbi:MAG: hypothetical protein Q9220_005414 [cf. Caloplaca sp. 1 TL-2023]
MKRRNGSEDEIPHSKKQKTTGEGSSNAGIEQISTARHLQDLLAFSQDNGPNIRLFKDFLISITSEVDAELQTSRRKILLDYLTSLPTSQDEGPRTFTFDLIQTWSFAAQSNNERLFSSITAVLVNFLNTISCYIDFQEVGRNFCNLLLHEDQLKLLERALSAQKSKDHLISPCLSLLTELVLFDGGFAAKRVYRNKDVTFKRLDTFLSLPQDATRAEFDSQQKPSIRTHALRYIFANLRMQDNATKIEILAQVRLFRSMFQDIKADSVSIVREMLAVAKTEILQDETVPRRVKGRLFTDHVLGCIATLYNYSGTVGPSQDELHDRGQESVPELAHAFLLSACINPRYGILHQKDGQELDLVNEEEGVHFRSTQQDQNIPLPLKQRQKRIVVKNTTLASFLQATRPYADDLQRRLVLAIFEAAPELIPDYFFKKRSFSFEPKLTATWVGFATFLLSTVHLPVDRHMMTLAKPSLLPFSIPDIIESILPLPLSPTIVSKCLNQNVVIIKFFVIKILNAAFDKLAQVLRQFRSVSQETDGVVHETREGAILEIIRQFDQRCPDMSHIITVFRTCSPQAGVLREASARLLSMYYRYLPSKALDQKFDVSPALSGALKEGTVIYDQRDQSDLGALNIAHLINIAQCSPDIRWWHKSDDGSLSLFGCGLKYFATLTDDPTIHAIQGLLRVALCESVSINSAYCDQHLALLYSSLIQTDDWQLSTTFLEFLDSCFTRLSKKAVKYHQHLLGLTAEMKHQWDSNIEYLSGDLLMVIMEQWPFMQRSYPMQEVETITDWLSRYLYILEHNGGDADFVHHIREEIKGITKHKQCRRVLSQSAQKNYTSLQVARSKLPADHELTSPRLLNGGNTMKENFLRQSWTPPSPPPTEDEDHPGLGKWRSFDIGEAVADGAIGELILCLWSNEREPLYLLTGEVVETANDWTMEKPLPYIAGMLAAESCLVLSHPLHKLYAKVNKFLNKGPVWSVKKLPSYWVEQILMHPPSIDEAHYQEVGWLLDLLVGGLRTAARVDEWSSACIFPGGKHLCRCTSRSSGAPNMAKRYSRAELEYLRNSPLVVKPARLPPTEEWMGPLPDPNPKKAPTRGKIEEAPIHDGSARRPVFERHMSRNSTNVPEDIILGPPKTAFASAAGARNSSRTFDSPSRPSFSAQADSTTRLDRQTFRENHTQHSTKDDANADASQDTRPGVQQHRHATNDQGPRSGRHSKAIGQDEGERGSRRNQYREQDRDRDTEPETKSYRGFENYRRDGATNETNEVRHNGQGRGRPDSSWYRAGEKDGEVFENSRDNARERDWRGKARGNVREADNDRSQNNKQEVDPEWMDEPDAPKKKQTHTQEDFERWKERMKAGNGPSQENNPPSRDQRPNHERHISGVTSPHGKVKVETPLVVDSNSDGFFGLWNDSNKQALSTDEGAAQTRTEAPKIKATKSSKFTGFFGTKPAPVEQVPDPQPVNLFAAPADSSSEDKKGFERILKLLDQQQSNPAKDGNARDQIFRNMPTSPTAQAKNEGQSSSNLPNLVSPRPKIGGPLPPNKDSEFLLNLMRQSRSGQANSTDARPNNSIPPELLPFSNLLVSPQQTPGPPPGLPNIMARPDAHTHDKLNPTAAPDRKGLPPGLFDAQRPGLNDQQRFSKDTPDFPPALAHQNIPQRQGMMPPPGFPAPLRNPSQFPPGLMANMPSAAGQDRGNFFGGPRMLGPTHITPPPPPGMPPPGFNNNNGNNAPPPGFPPMMAFNQEQRIFVGGGGGLPRPAMEAYNGEGAFVPVPGPFRRQD